MSACPHCGEDHDDDVVLGEQISVRVRKPVGAVVAVRMTREMITGLDREAHRRGTTISEIVRSAIDQMMSPRIAYTESSSSAATQTIRGMS